MFEEVKKKGAIDIVISFAKVNKKEEKYLFLGKGRVVRVVNQVNIVVNDTTRYKRVLVWVKKLVSRLLKGVGNGFGDEAAVGVWNRNRSGFL